MEIRRVKVFKITHFDRKHLKIDETPEKVVIFEAPMECVIPVVLTEERSLVFPTEPLDYDTYMYVGWGIAFERGYETEKLPGIAKLARRFGLNPWLVTNAIQTADAL